MLCDQMAPASKQPETPAPVQRLTAQEEYAAFLEGKDLTKPVARPAPATQTPGVRIPPEGRPSGHSFTFIHSSSSFTRNPRSLLHSWLVA